MTHLKADKETKCELFVTITEENVNSDTCSITAI